MLSSSLTHHLVIIALSSYCSSNLLVYQSISVTERQFDHSVQMALVKVADTLSKDHIIKKLSSNFFFVDTHSDINDTELDRLLKNEFELRDLDVSYELGIYRSDDDTLVYGSYIEAMKKLSAKDYARFRGYSGEKNFAVEPGISY